MTTILEAAHELHGGDETPQPMDCPVCEADIDYFIRYGEGQPDHTPDSRWNEDAAGFVVAPLDWKGELGAG